MNKRPKDNNHAAGMSRNLEIPLTLTDDGRYFVKYKGKILVEGTYTISGDKIVLTDERAVVARNRPEIVAANID